MNQSEIDYTAADRGKAEGMGQALGHAESVEPGWGDLAYEWLAHYVAGEKGVQFTSFLFISWCQLNDFDMPPTQKAFGSIFTKAAKNGLIRKVGYRPHPLRHASPTVLWEVV
jgi:hypothetical protein